MSPQTDFETGYGFFFGEAGVLFVNYYVLLFTKAISRQEDMHDGIKNE